jgi:hypothetical protein
MEEDTRIGVGLMWLMDKSGLENNVRMVLQHHREKFGYEAEYVLANPVDLVGVMPEAKPDEPQAPLIICGVRVVPNISTISLHLFAGKKVPRTGHP